MKWHKIWRWFNIWWWRYLFEEADDPGYCPWWERLWCRIKNHPDGPWYYNPGHFEPHMHCKRCGDEL
jgi:hypothetical protein